MKSLIRFSKYHLVLFVIVCISGCKKSVLVDLPSTQLASAAVYENNATAGSVLTGIYSNMSLTGISGGLTGLSIRGGILSDELDNYNKTNVELAGIYSNSLKKTNNYYWDEIFKQIFISNAAIEGLTASIGLKPPLKKQLLGEAQFMRAFLHFYAVNLYGEFPLVTTTDYRINTKISRTSKDQVYAQIVIDLLTAQQNLDDNYRSGTNQIVMERIRPNKSAATALLARVYLYMGQWANAESEATKVIQNTSNFSLLSDLEGVFLANSKEAIWQLQPVQPGLNTNDAPQLVLTSAPNERTYFALSDKLKNAFDQGDGRFNKWVGKITVSGKDYYFPYKYKIYQQNQGVTEYTMVLRLAEQYLIRAEARAQQNKLSEAIEDINALRQNRRSSPTTTIPNPLPSLQNTLSQVDILSAIAHERQTELFTEWGHRWFDLKRTAKIDEVMASLNAVKNRIWTSNAALFPIPQSEILINPNLKQNQGYN